jgi:transcriptional regulator with XRE-family HTH domain
LSYRAELDLTQIGRIERGVTNTSLSILGKIANGLGVELKELFDFKDLD